MYGIASVSARGCNLDDGRTHLVCTNCALSASNQNKQTLIFESLEAGSRAERQTNRFPI